jgi:hypothetical protein
LVRSLDDVEYPAPVPARKKGPPAPLMFACPNTHVQTSTGIATDVATLRRFWTRWLNISCPHCGNVHRIDVRETYLNGVLDSVAVAPPVKGVDFAVS